VAVRLLLHRYLDPGSLDDLFALWERHEGAAVEFTAFEGPVGVLAGTGRNTLWWEWRHY
jgi:hypothetical protein